MENKRSGSRPSGGDIVWIAPGEKHWHGATSTTAMTHIAIAEKLNGSPVDWMEKVTGTIPVQSRRATINLDDGSRVKC
jgi:hypothetical protein